MDRLKSCTISRYTKHAVTITLDGDAVIIERYGKAARIPVVEGIGYTYKCLKTRLKASGGAEGFFRWAKKLADDPEAPCVSLLYSVADFYTAKAERISAD